MSNILLRKCYYNGYSINFVVQKLGIDKEVVEYWYAIFDRENISNQ